MARCQQSSQRWAISVCPAAPRRALCMRHRMRACCPHRRCRCSGTSNTCRRIISSCPCSCRQPWEQLLPHSIRPPARAAPAMWSIPMRNMDTSCSSIHIHIINCRRRCRHRRRHRCCTIQRATAPPRPRRRRQQRPQRQRMRPFWPGRTWTCSDSRTRTMTAAVRSKSTHGCRLACDRIRWVLRPFGSCLICDLCAQISSARRDSTPVH